MIPRELWEGIRRLHLADGLSVSALARRFERDRKTVRRCGPRLAGAICAKHAPRRRPAVGRRSIGASPV